MIAKGVNALRSPKRAILMITHYDRLPQLITPDYVHILMEGKIVRSGDASLAKEIERVGYKV